jgi:DNA repair protein RecO (recombination protein O)
MSPQARRQQFELGYLLHHTAYRDSGRILEVLTREHGRLSLFARGVRGPKAKLAAVLQPFQPLLLSWSGHSEAPQLTGAELGAAFVRAPAGALMACFYLNELLLKLTTRHDPHPRLYDAYHETLQALKAGAVLERSIRIFEKRLLEEVGYGLDLTSASGSPAAIDPQGYYLFRPAQGLVPVAREAREAIPGSSLVSLAGEQLATPGELHDARRVLQAALSHCLEGRSLNTRTVARALLHRES